MEMGRKIEIEGEKSAIRYGTKRRNHNNSKATRSQGSHWEKKFCTLVCSIPWKKLCETEKLKYMYPKIVEWNDSEGKEAFNIAKARYWAEINHLPCPIPLPDPNMYIDIVDDNAVLDPELVEDLYKLPPSQNDEGVWDSFKFTTENVPVTGWGDEEEDQVHTVYACATDQSIQIQPTGWDDEEYQAPATYGNDVQIQPTGWGDEEDQVMPIYGNNQSIQNSANGVKDNYCDYQCERDYSWQHQGYRKQGRSHFGLNFTNGRYSGKKKVTNEQQAIRYKTQWVPVHSCDPMKYGGGHMAVAEIGVIVSGLKR